MEVCCCNHHQHGASGAWHTCASVGPPEGLLNSWSSDTCLIFFAFKYKQHYLAPHRHRIKICNVFQWWSLENSVQGSPHPPFSLILLDMKGEEEGARPWNVNSFWADFSNCLNFTISLLSKIRKDDLTGCSSWTLLLLLSYFTNYTIKLIDSWGKPRL